MSKVCLLSDTHFGLKQGSQLFHKYYEKSYSEFIFPELKRRDIKIIFQFGDIFDNRRAVDTISIAESRRYFFDLLENDGIEFRALIGNHDLPYKNSLDSNSPMELLTNYANVTLWDMPINLSVGKFSVDIIPWICKDNYDEIMKFVEESTSDILFAHLELDGFCMQKGVKSHGGMSPTIFKKYKHVYSGHYHSKSSDGNVTYLGIPYENTWADCDDSKGIHIFDDETGELEFIKNPFTMFTKIHYDEDSMDGISPINITDHFVRLYVIKNTDKKEYDKFVSKIQSLNPYELKIVEDAISVESEVDGDIDLQDTPNLIDNYIENLETDLDKERIKKMMRTLYIESMEVE